MYSDYKGKVKYKIYVFPFQGFKNNFNAIAINTN